MDRLLRRLRIRVPITGIGRGTVLELAGFACLAAAAWLAFGLPAGLAVAGAVALFIAQGVE